MFTTEHCNRFRLPKTWRRSARKMTLRSWLGSRSSKTRLRPWRVFSDKRRALLLACSTGAPPERSCARLSRMVFSASNTCGFWSVGMRLIGSIRCPESTAQWKRCSKWLTATSLPKHWCSIRHTIRLSRVSDQSCTALRLPENYYILCSLLILIFCTNHIPEQIWCVPGAVYQAWLFHRANPIEIYWSNLILLDIPLNFDWIKRKLNQEKTCNPQIFFLWWQKNSCLLKNWWIDRKNFIQIRFSKIILVIFYPQRIIPFIHLNTNWSPKSFLKSFFI